MGGAAVVYRHAAGLHARGHQVSVIAPRRDGTLASRALELAVRVRNAAHGVASRPLYHVEGVETWEPPSWHQAEGVPYDAVIATGFQTAEWVSRLTKEGRGFYFIQGDERSLSPSAAQTWSLPLVRIAVSSWVADRVRACGHPVDGVIPNAIDPSDFALDIDLGDREERVVALYHRHRVKGPEVLLDALTEIRRLRPTAQASVVSARPPRHRLPGWVDVEIRPDRDRLRKVYNRSAVCLHTSASDGWGLVPMEAAACGCAVVATASGGPSEYLRAGRSMIEVAVGDGVTVGRQAADLLAAPQARARLAEAALADVARFSWDASTDAFEALLRRRIS